MKLPNLITLTTDFGLQDAYVGQIKGAILRRNIDARIIDLTHAIDAQDILAAAVTIRSSYHYFPQESVHMVVVDPGVGSQRKILVMKADNHLFVAPDNGALTFLIRDKKTQAVHRVANRSLFPDEISATFHGRDIMAPVAAALADGMKIAEVGPAINIEDCVQLDIQKTQLDKQGITGRVIHIDRFGNIQTTITSGNISLYQPSSFAGIVIRSQKINAISTTYSDSAAGELVAVIDSAGHLEIAVNRGNAAEQINCEIGDPVTVVMEGSRD
ncbi:MAG: SAM-dependent chlorinase/fluorinase [Desulfobulbaceae bacterium]|nr:SAM-dependent chlorinase/fluorinase [Desulfobulbaceae bacterium]